MAEQVKQAGEAPDTKTQEEIEEFLKMTPEGKSIQDRETQEVEANTPAARFDPEVDYGTPTEEDLKMAEAMYLPNIPDPTEEQKDLYIKAILLDEPFELNLSSMGGKFNIAFKGRSQRAQTDIVRNMRIAMALGDVPEDNPLINLAYVQYFNLLYSIVSINSTPLVNGKPPKSNFSSLPDVAKNISEEDMRKDPNYRWYMDNTNEIILSMQQIRLNHIIEQAKIFEGLCAKLATEVTRPNFSQAQDEQP